jgi:ATP-binding protein involved in chromosome partitioning
MKDTIEKALSTVKYPGFDKDIIALGMVEEVAGDDNLVVVKMKSLTAAGETREKLIEDIKNRLAKEGLNCEVQFPDPKQPVQQPGEQPPQRREPMPKRPIVGVKNIIPVASGKGGVGKSTVSVNLAIALAKAGHRVGLLDLDAYGPSIHTMLGLTGQHQVSDKGKLLPAEKHGIKVISVGLLLDKGMPLIWRGPMVAKLVMQFFYDVEWGEIDFLVMDLPPGTGDVQLTMIQKLEVTGAVIVTTPQDVALTDAEKAVNMFKQTDTNVLGIVENMSVFVCPHCKKESEIFGSGGGKKESERAGVPLLGQIPLEGRITSSGDSGDPVALSEEGVGGKFKEIAAAVADALAGSRRMTG